MSMALDGGLPRSRRTDPMTSVDAGRSADLSGSQQQVLDVFEVVGAPLADHELVAEARALGCRCTAQRLRSARAELAMQGRVVLAEGVETKTPSGRRARVWRLADDS